MQSSRVCTRSATRINSAPLVAISNVSSPSSGRTSSSVASSDSGRAANAPDVVCGAIVADGTAASTARDTRDVPPSAVGIGSASASTNCWESLIGGATGSGNSVGGGRSSMVSDAGGGPAAGATRSRSIWSIFSIEIEPEPVIEIAISADDASPDGTSPGGSGAGSGAGSGSGSGRGGGGGGGVRVRAIAGGALGARPSCARIPSRSACVRLTSISLARSCWLASRNER